MWFWRTERAWQMLHFAQRPADRNRRAQRFFSPGIWGVPQAFWPTRLPARRVPNWKETRTPCLVLHLYFQTLTASHCRMVIIASSDWICLWFVLVVQNSLSDHASNRYSHWHRRSVTIETLKHPMRIGGADAKLATVCACWTCFDCSKLSFLHPGRFL